MSDYPASFPTRLSYVSCTERTGLSLDLGLLLQRRKILLCACISNSVVTFFLQISQLAVWHVVSFALIIGHRISLTESIFPESSKNMFFQCRLAAAWAIGTLGRTWVIDLWNIFWWNIDKTSKIVCFLWKKTPRRAARITECNNKFVRNAKKSHFLAKKPFIEGLKKTLYWDSGFSSAGAGMSRNPKNQLRMP